ncbi:MAG: ComEC family competence protein, partial [Chlorobi bacterium]|nr:ComEC family competence protein [Chlorobiota bacterium]
MQQDFFKQFPLLRIVIPLIAGIWFYEKLKPDWLYSFFVFGLFLFFVWLITAYRFIKKPVFRLRFLPATFFVLFVFVFGILWMYLRQTEVVDSDSEVLFKGYVISDMGETEISRKLKVRSVVLMSDSFVLNKELTGVLYLKKGAETAGLKPGDVFYIKGRLFSFDKPVNPYSFDYSAYLKRERVSFRMWSGGDEIIVTNEHYEVFDVEIAKLRDNLVEYFKSSEINGEELALLRAMFLGDRSALNPEDKQSFASAGVIHLLAVSGLHLGIVYLLISFLLSPLRNRRFYVISSVVIILIIWMYALLTGLSSSVFRAAVMFTMMETGKLLKRPGMVYNQLLASMLIIIIIEPYSVFKAGFWLSHTAVAGIVYFYPLLNNLVSFHFLPFRWLWSLIAVSISAQITTFPLSIYLFHKFPVYFILGNILLVPLLTPVLLLTFIAVVLSFLPTGNSVSLMLLSPVNELTGFMLEVVNYIKSLPGAVINYISISEFQFILIGVLFVSLIMYTRKQVVNAYFTALVTAILLMSSFTYHKIKNYTKESFVVFYEKGKGLFNYLKLPCNIVL